MVRILSLCAYDGNKLPAETYETNYVCGGMDVKSFEKFPKV
jgi:hypothetical protein